MVAAVFSDITEEVCNCVMYSVASVQWYSGEQRTPQVAVGFAVLVSVAGRLGVSSPGYRGDAVEEYLGEAT